MQDNFAAPVRRSIRALLADGTSDPSFREKIALGLKTFPNPLHPRSPMRAAMLTLGAFRTAGGGGDAGVWAAAAMEVTSTALHILDGIQDGERSAGPGDLHIATAALYLAGIGLERARGPQRAGAAGVPWSDYHALMLTVGSGQQQDLDFQRRNDVTLAESQAMTMQKTGAYGEAMALCGALAASAGPELCAQLRELGRHLGMYGQLMDDASDASPAAPGTADLRLRKKTVPLVFFLDHAQERPDWARLLRRFLAGRLLKTEEHALRVALKKSGALRFTLTLANWYKMQANAILERLADKGWETQLLRRFLAEPEQPSSELERQAV